MRSEATIPNNMSHPPRLPLHAQQPAQHSHLASVSAATSRLVHEEKKEEVGTASTTMHGSNSSSCLSPTRTLPLPSSSSQPYTAFCDLMPCTALSPPSSEGYYPIQQLQATLR